MNEIEKAEKLKTIFEHFGYKNQLKKLNEECYEAIESINDYETELENKPFPNEETWEHIVEEIADLEVVLSQFKMVYGIPKSKIEDMQEFKIQRTIDRINNGEY